MSEEVTTYSANKELKNWLEKNHPDILEEALKITKERPNWDLQDACDEVDSSVYNYWSECEEEIAYQKPPLEEGYHTVVGHDLNHDCDHGACIGYELENGWTVYTYEEKPELISFHFERPREA